MLEAHHISVMVRTTLNLHALNNENTEGNVQLLRKANIVLPSHDNDTASYDAREVNAISGAMGKYMYETALKNAVRDLALPMSEGVKQNSPERIWADKSYRDFVQQTSNLEMLYDSILSCTVTDVCGVLILEAGTQIKRKSTIEFGWIFSIPPFLQPETHIRTRNQPIGSGKSDSQMLFAQETTSGVYATTARFNVNRIGYNDYARTYPDTVISQTKNDNNSVAVDRIARFKACLYALENSLLAPQGAGTSTQMPHVTDIKGMICVSTVHSVPPLISPLNDSYRDQVQILCDRDNQRFNSGVRYAFPFDNAVGLSQSIDQISQQFVPAKI